jgi:predicted molibdopterin-dependent oxidoreductase YjgC
MTFYTLGITEHICGTNNVMSIANLAMLTGHLGRPHTGVNPIRGQNNVQGACVWELSPMCSPDTRELPTRLLMINSKKHGEYPCPTNWVL